MDKLSVVFVMFVALGFVGSFACTGSQRKIVRTVVDLAEEACADRDSLSECLGKMQSQAQPAEPVIAPDAGTDAE